MYLRRSLRVRRRYPVRRYVPRRVRAGKIRMISIRR